MISVRFFLHGKFQGVLSLQTLPRIGEHVTAGLFPGTCTVVDVVHVLAKFYVDIYLTA